MRTLLILSLVIPSLASASVGIGTGSNEEIFNLPRVSLVKSVGVATPAAGVAPSAFTKPVRNASSSLTKDAAVEMASAMAVRTKGGSIAVVADTPGQKMSPAIPPHSVLVLEAVSIEQLRQNDIIVFDRPNGSGVSRVITVNSAGARVCGDQSNAVEIIDPKSIRKRVVAVLYCQAGE